MGTPSPGGTHTCNCHAGTSSQVKIHTANKQHNGVVGYCQCSAMYCVCADNCDAEIQAAVRASVFVRGLCMRPLLNSKENSAASFIVVCLFVSYDMISVGADVNLLWKKKTPCANVGTRLITHSSWQAVGRPSSNPRCSRSFSCLSPGEHHCARSRDYSASAKQDWLVYV